MIFIYLLIILKTNLNKLEVKKIRPYTCPVCGGSGVVPHGFYELLECWSSANTSQETCRTCHGTGVVWG